MKSIWTYEINPDNTITIFDKSDGYQKTRTLEEFKLWYYRNKDPVFRRDDPDYYFMLDCIRDQLLDKGLINE